VLDWVLPAKLLHPKVTKDVTESASESSSQEKAELVHEFAFLSDLCGLFSATFAVKIF
jgi:hypothetical protein